MQTAHPEVDYEGGVSAVLCNTGRGVAAIEALKPRVRWGESSLDKVLPGNPSLVRPVTPYEKRGRFMADLGDGTLRAREPPQGQGGASAMEGVTLCGSSWSINGYYCHEFP